MLENFGKHLWAIGKFKFCMTKVKVKLNFLLIFLIGNWQYPLNYHSNLKCLSPRLNKHIYLKFYRLKLILKSPKIFVKVTLSWRLFRQCFDFIGIMRNKYKWIYDANQRWQHVYLIWCHKKDEVYWSSFFAFEARDLNLTFSENSAITNL